MTVQDQMRLLLGRLTLAPDSVPERELRRLGARVLRFARSRCSREDARKVRDELEVLLALHVIGAASRDSDVGASVRRREGQDAFALRGGYG